MADINIKISEGKAALAQLEKLKNSFFEEREVALIKKINKILEESGGILNQAKSNYTEVHALYLEVCECVDFINECYADIKKQVDDFNEKSTAQQETIIRKEEELSELRKRLENDFESIKKDRQFVENQRTAMQGERRKLIDGQEALKRAIDRLKINKI